LEFTVITAANRLKYAGENSPWPHDTYGIVACYVILGPPNNELWRVFSLRQLAKTAIRKVTQLRAFCDAQSLEKSFPIAIWTQLEVRPLKASFRPFP
jgi:hypothetical protein